MVANYQEDNLEQIAAAEFFLENADWAFPGLYFDLSLVEILFMISVGLILYVSSHICFWYSGISSHLINNVNKDKWSPVGLIKFFNALIEKAKIIVNQIKNDSKLKT